MLLYKAQKNALIKRQVLLLTVKNSLFNVQATYNCPIALQLALYTYPPKSKSNTLNVGTYKDIKY